TVIKNDYCIGCGACSFVDSNYRIQLDQYGMYKTTLDYPNSPDDGISAKVCPFSNSTNNEDFIAEEKFGNVKNYNKYIGKYIKNYVGYVDEGEYREKGSSGGAGKWILNELLKNDLVDYVIQVVSTNEPDNLFTFKVFAKGDDILVGSKSAYYPVNLKDPLSFIRENEGRYAITAIPCFSKAIRNICLYDTEMARKIKFIIGIICGHLKSSGFAESLGWQLGVEPHELRGIEFRGKIKGLNANEKGVFATDALGCRSITESSKKLLGGNWGYGFFKYKACDYCDDIVGETTDVSIGDAWIDELMKDDKGNNVLIIRNEIILEMIIKAIKEKRLQFTEVDENVIVQSQLGGIRHRREGLGYRLMNKIKNNQWVPIKRVEPSNKLPYDRKRIYRVREEIRDASHRIFKKAKEINRFDYFSS